MRSTVRNMTLRLRTRLLLAAMAENGMSTAEYSAVELYIPPWRTCL